MAGEPDPSVRLLESAPLAVPEPVQRRRSLAPLPRQRSRLVPVVALLVLLWILLLVWLRLSGRG